jgi:hypothetical protein
MLTSRGQPARTSCDVQKATKTAALQRTKLGFSEAYGKSGDYSRNGGFPLPFRAQSVENLGENYQRPKNMSTWLT